MKKVVLISDSFKGCLSSFEVEAAAAEGVREVFPACEVVQLPVADGGEGLLDVLVRLTKGRYVEAEVHDPLMRPISVRYGIVGDGQTAIIEMAEASGLPLLSATERNPMVATSYGTGELIRLAIESGIRKIILGIGGSATNDAGMGMMQALGARYFDQNGGELGTGCGKLLASVENIDLSEFEKRTKGVVFSTACDVNNPFCGPNGAAYVFAPQKGADAEMVELLDEGLRHFAEVVARVTGKNIENVPGAGAAGGIGGAMSASFTGALQPGIDLVLEKMDFAAQVAGASLVITGEGKADRQTLMGKVPAGVLKAARKENVAVALVAGKVEDENVLLSAGFRAVVASTPLNMPLDEALQPDVAKANIKNTVRTLMQQIQLD